jgi:hypothetical protein
MWHFPLEVEVGAESQPNKPKQHTRAVQYSMELEPLLDAAVRTDPATNRSLVLAVLLVVVNQVHGLLLMALQCC